jgi:peptidoglycan/xylan/chitin deacetylase (PgdA/CDA1 family)
MPFIGPLVATGGLCAAGGIFSWAAVAPSSQVFGPTIRRTGDKSTIALTFDDGPNPAITPALLDLLDRYEARATFFQIGKYVRAHPRLASEVVKRGHTIGNHTDSHPRLVFLHRARILEELQRCQDALVSATGNRSRWMRPPYGFRGPQLEGAVRRWCENAQVVMWSVSSCDWRPGPSEKIIQRLRQARGGDIVLLHDGDHRMSDGNRHNTLAALQYWLPRWKDARIRLASMDDLAGPN